MNIERPTSNIEHRMKKQRSNKERRLFTLPCKVNPAVTFCLSLSALSFQLFVFARDFFGSGLSGLEIKRVKRLGGQND